MDLTIIKLRYLRIAQLSLLICYTYFLLEDNMFLGLPMLFIFGLLEYVYPSDYANQSFWHPYKIKTIFFKKVSRGTEVVLELAFVFFLGFVLSIYF